MSDSVDVVEFHPNRDDAASAVQSWLDDNSGITSIDHVTRAYEKRGRVGLAIIYQS